MFKLPKDFDPSKNLGRAQVIMNPILQLNMIRLNNEVTGHLAARYKGSGKKPGDIVTEDEVGEIQDFKLIKQDDDMSRQVVMIRIKGAW